MTAARLSIAVTITLLLASLFVAVATKSRSQPEARSQFEAGFYVACPGAGGGPYRTLEQAKAVSQCNNPAISQCDGIRSCYILIAEEQSAPLASGGSGRGVLIRVCSIYDRDCK